MSEFAHAQGLMIASNEYSGKTRWGPDSQTDKKKITRGTFMGHSMQRIDRPMAHVRTMLDCSHQTRHRVHVFAA